MKNWMKLCLSLGLACVLLGGAAAGVGYAMGGKMMTVALSTNGLHLKAFPWGSKGTVTESRETLSPFHAIDAKLDYGDLTIETGTQYAISINKSEQVNVKCEVQDGVLTVKGPDSFVLLFGSTTGPCSVTVTVPANARLERVEASSDLGIVKVRDIEAEEMTLSSNLGDVTAENVTAQAIDLDSDLGRVNAIALFAQELELKANMGDIEATDVTVTGLLEFDCDMGKVSLSGSVADVSGSCNMGDVVLNANGAEEDYDYELSCEMGKVNLNGDKRGNDYSRNHGAPHTIQIHADMGNVEVITQGQVTVIN